MLAGKYKRLVSQMELIKWQIQNKKLNQVQILQFQEFQSVVFLCSGPLDSPYEGYCFRVKIQWPSDYPFRPPKCTLLDKIWNPFIDFESGQICMDILSYNFSPALTTIHIIMSLISLLSENKISQNNDGFLNPAAAIEMLKNCPYFNQHARDLSQKHSYKKKQIYTDNMRGIPQEHVIQVESEQIPDLISENLTTQKFNKKPKIVKQLKEESEIEVLLQNFQIQDIEPLKPQQNSSLSLNNASGSQVPNDISAGSNDLNNNHLPQVSNSCQNPHSGNNTLNQRQRIHQKRPNSSESEVLTQDKFQEQVEKHRAKIKANLQIYGSLNPPSLNQNL